MHRPIRTAVATSASLEMMRSIALLLAESDIELLSAARNGAEAIECLKADRPDLLVADTPLPAIDGAALIERALATFCLPVRPRAILLCPPDFATHFRDKTEALSAVLIEKPLNRAAFSDAICRLTDSAPVFPESECGFMEKLLSELGFPEHTGRNILKYSVMIHAHGDCAPGSIAETIAMAAELCGCTAAQAERAIRFAIAKAWQSDKFENQYRIFSDTVDAGRGQPTLSEMISRLADILRLEG